MKLKKVTFEGWKNCIEIKNGNFKLIVTTEIGPRIISASYGDSGNLFMVDPKLKGKKGGPGWVNYGGHRLWHSPETKERTYEPDNGESKVDIVDLGDGGLEFITPANPLTGMSKSLAILPSENETFRVVHTLRNNGVWEIEAAAWALSVMAPGGTLVAPQNQNETQLLPTTFFSYWPYSKMNDPRLIQGEKFLIVKQNPKIKEPFKIGYNCQDGWIAYINKGIAFVKQFIYDPEEDYPDNGCSVECYTCGAFLEAETLSPLQLLEPGDEIRHVELWSALPADFPVNNEQDAIDLFGDDDCCCDDECCCHEEKKETKNVKKKAAAKTAKKAASGKKKK